MDDGRARRRPVCHPRAVAVATRTIKLGTAISSVFVRSAPTIAMAAATVDCLSGGRFILGLGSSHRVQVEGEHGIPFVQPVQRLRETVEIVRAILREGTVSFQGRAIGIERFDLWFTPGRREIPVFVAALFAPLLEACGEMANGVILTWSTLDAARRAAVPVTRGTHRAGRRPGKVEIVSLLPCYVAASRAEARDQMRPSVALYAGFFPRYNRLLAESGFPDAARTIKREWDTGIVPQPPGPCPIRSWRRWRSSALPTNAGRGSKSIAARGWRCPSSVHGPAAPPASTWSCKPCGRARHE